MRLVAVAVDQHDVPRAQQRHVDDLVGGGGAVGDEEGALGAEAAGRQFLGFLDGPGRVQQRVQSTGGGAGLGHEQVVAVEPAEVPDPPRVEHRVPAGDRQRVEIADGPVGILPEGIEERGLHPGPDAIQHGHVQLVCCLEAVEHPPEQLGRALAGLGQRFVGEQVQVQLRAQVAKRERECLADRVGGLLERGQYPVHRGPHQRGGQRPRRPRREAAPHHHRLDVGVAHDRQPRLLERGHRQQLVDQIAWSFVPQLDQVLSQPRKLCVAHRIDQQHGEVVHRRIAPQAGLGQRRPILPLAQSIDQFMDQRAQLRHVGSPVQLAQVLDAFRARVDPEALDLFQSANQVLGLGPLNPSSARRSCARRCPGCGSRCRCGAALGWPRRSATRNHCPVCAATPPCPPPPPRLLRPFVGRQFAADKMLGVPREWQPHFSAPW